MNRVLSEDTVRATNEFRCIVAIVRKVKDSAGTDAILRWANTLLKGLGLQIRKLEG